MAKLCLCNFTFPFLVLLLSLLFGRIRADFTNPFKDIGCNLISCGEGTCVSSNESFLGFGCECKPGWKKIQIGSLSFPSCVVPNCSIDYGCGSNTSSRPPAPPPPASLLPPLNFSDPCAMTWCGDGTCTANGTGHICSCHEGYSNLLNRTNLACFKQCYLGADCANLGFDIGSPSPASNSPSSDSESTGNGANGKPILWRTQLAFFILPLITATFIYSV